MDICFYLLPRSMTVRLAWTCLKPLSLPDAKEKAARARQSWQMLSCVFLVLAGHAPSLWDSCSVAAEYTALSFEGQSAESLREISSDSTNKMLLPDCQITLMMVLEQQSDRLLSALLGKRRNNGFVTKSLFPSYMKQWRKPGDDIESGQKEPVVTKAQVVG